MKKVGKYVLTYSATDKTGNVGSVKRTVIVHDTLRPVIALDYDGIFFRETYGGKGNPANKHFKVIKQQLIEDAALSGAGGWTAHAIAACGVVGVAAAFAALSTRRLVAVPV